MVSKGIGSNMIERIAREVSQDVRQADDLKELILVVGVECPACNGVGQFGGVGASSVCRRCLGRGFLEVPDSFSSVVE